MALSTRETASRPLIRSMGSAALARAGTLAAGFAFTTITARIVYRDAGAELFGTVMLLATLQALAPFADLGVGAAVMNVIAESHDARRDPKVRTVLSTALVVTVGVALAFIVFSVFPYLLDWHPRGTGMSGTAFKVSLSVSLALIGFGVPLGLGNRILIGLNRTHTAVLLAATSYPIALLVIASMSVLGIEPILYAIAWPFSTVTANLLILASGVRSLGQPVGDILRGCRGLGRFDFGHVMGVAAPMFVLSVLTPIGYQADRIILGVWGTPLDLTHYSLAAQIYTPLVGLLSIAATPLWPIFAGWRGNGLGAAFRKMILGFAGLGLLVGLAFPFSSRVYFWLVGASTGGVSEALLVAFGVLIFLQAAMLPISMRMTSRTMLRAQAVALGVATLVNLTLSVLLTRHFGAVGPVAASAAALALCQIFPCWVIVSRGNRNQAEFRVERGDTSNEPRSA